jgi:hypothetical protein
MTRHTPLSFAIEEPTSEANRTRWGDDERLSTSVVLAVAEALAIDPTGLDPMLYDTLDPDALDRLFASDVTPTSLTFDLADCSVTVRADREIVVRPNR